MTQTADAASQTADDLTTGARIARYRRRRGMTQECLAGLVGRTVDWLGKVEHDRIPVDRLSVLRALAVALRVSVGDLTEPELFQRSAPAIRRWPSPPQP